MESNRLLNVRLEETVEQISLLVNRIVQLEKQVKQQDERIKVLEGKAKDEPIESNIINGARASAEIEEATSQLAINGPSNNSVARPGSIPIDSGCTRQLEPQSQIATEYIEWMNSTQRRLSLWYREEYRKALVHYIGRIYGKKNDQADEIVQGLDIESPMVPELDQLYRVIHQFEIQPGAQESLQRYQQERRPSNRIREIETFFRTSSHQRNKIDRRSIKGYFDLICRDGVVAEEIGRFVNLPKEKIFGGDEENLCSERVTFTQIDLNSQSRIHLDDNQVDLITCLVTLHHVPHLESMLKELARILQPDGYLIVREHDCRRERSLRTKYLNFVHGFMMIAEIGEFSRRPDVGTGQVPERKRWEQQRQEVLEYTQSIQYRSRDEWRDELAKVGFNLTDQFNFNNQQNRGSPQALYYDVFQLKKRTH